MTLDLGIGLAEYVRGVRDGSISCEEFVAATLERISEHDAELHAYVSVNAAGALDAARGVDRVVRARGDPGTLAGAPFGIKDNICVARMRTTCCSWMLEEYESPYDATVVRRLRDSGGIVVGKTNTDEFAMGLTTEFSAFGPTSNPWDPRRVPGGSSGGSAAAVSSLECIASLGSDTGGSVRNPASFCGIVGYKPTYGLLSRYGLISYANSIEQVGIMTRSVADAAQVMNAISGEDVMDDTTRAGPDRNTKSSKTNYADHIGVGADGLVVGLDVDAVDESTAVGRAMRRAADALEAAGATVVDVRLDHAEMSVAAYYVITAAEAGSNLARYDNLRYGYDLPSDGYEYNAYIKRARARLGPEVTRRMILGGFVPSAGQAGRYYLKALKARDALSEEADRAFSSQRLACIMAPTVPVPPFKFGEKIDDPIELFRMDSNTVMANLTGRPSISVPFASADGLPIGIQLTGAHAHDSDLFGIANALYELSESKGVPHL